MSIISKVLGNQQPPQGIPAANAVPTDNASVSYGNDQFTSTNPYATPVNYTVPTQVPFYVPALASIFKGREKGQMLNTTSKEVRVPIRPEPAPQPVEPAPQPQP